MPHSIIAAAVQMPSDLLQVKSNLARADGLLMVAHQAGADLAVLPEMFNTGYGLLTVYDRYAEPVDGPTMMHLRRRSREWGMVIAAGFVERDGPSIYNAMGLCLPDGSISVYRKRHLALWERSQFQPGREPLVVTTRWGRVGLAICRRHDLRAGLVRLSRSARSGRDSGRLAELRRPEHQSDALARRQARAPTQHDSC